LDISYGDVGGSYCCLDFSTDVNAMTASRRQPPINDDHVLATNAPYAERADHQPNRFDTALLAAWGSIVPRLLSGLGRRRLKRVALLAEGHQKTVATFSERRLREAANGLRRELYRQAFEPNLVGWAFALTREAAYRYVGMRHHHVQLLGGAAMMSAALVEMETGEGKTLTALLPAVTAALAGQPVHVVTVNGYLARRDFEHLRPVYEALGLTVGLAEHGQNVEQRRAAYGCDVTYCTNKDLVFDYLRDRLTLGSRRARSRLLLERLLTDDDAAGNRLLLLRGLQFAIVDEADSVLIDEARTPLILSGADKGLECEAARYETALDIARQLTDDVDFSIQASEASLRLTPAGKARLIGLTAGHTGIWQIRRAREELIQQALSALHLFRRDFQYIIADDKVQIVDEYTGRVLPDRSWERGLHQLIEAKEGCSISTEKQTLARITYQRFFRRYLHLCGMTGTAIETAGELRATYGLQVVRLPTNRPSRRMNAGNRIYADDQEKWQAVVEAVLSARRVGRPTLIGTRSVEASERLDKLLREAGIVPVVLNARQDREEAQIVASAGKPGRVTVATNIAGRGTDIQPDRAVLAAGGLHVILTEYHDSRRIDRQLFGRAGRQGDPGSYESIVALSDELFRRFAGRQLFWLSRTAARLFGQVPAILLTLLRRQSQSSAERSHAGLRRQALSDELRSQQALGFAGRSE
jgi:preprotein translocase subunit SecA